MYLFLMLKKNSIFLFFSLLLFFGACSNAEIEENRVPVATVFDKVLYLDELEGVVPAGLSEDDSLTKISKYIENWIKKELIIKKAELSLTSEQKELERELQEYRESLLIHMYQEKVIATEMDTTVSEEEISQYYNENSQEFHLGFNVVKGIFIKIPKEHAINKQIEHLYDSENQSDKIKLDDLARDFAAKYDRFNDDWVQFNTLLEKIPYEISDSENFLKNNSTMRTSDETFTYYVKIYNYKLVSDIAPLPFVKDNVKSIILTKRRKALIEQIEMDIYQNALQEDLFKVLEVN
jgi:hypothetical protein